MPTRKNPLADPEAAAYAAGADDLGAAVLDFIRRGQRAQATVDAILTAEPERRRVRRPKGRA